MIERVRLRRAHEAGITKCVLVLIIGNKRYEQDRPLGWVSVRDSFPEKPTSDEDLEEWADRILEA
jgi:hypothetical protein